MSMAIAIVAWGTATNPPRADEPALPTADGSPLGDGSPADGLPANGLPPSGAEPAIPGEPADLAAPVPPLVPAPLERFGPQGDPPPRVPLPIDTAPAGPTAPLPAADGTVSVLAPSTVPPPSDVRPLPDMTGGGALRTLPVPPPAALPIPPGAAPRGALGAAAPANDAPDPSASRPPPPFAATLSAKSLEAPGLNVPTSPAAAANPPRPLTLLESLERSPDRSRRLWITQAYWKLAAAAARSRFAAESEDRLALIAPGGNPEDLALLDLDTASARAESASAGVELVAAQQELIDLVRLPVSDPPPWPIDIPLTAAYQTHFETIFAARPATGRVRAIHRQLPMQHAAVVARGEAVDAAERRFSALEGLHAKGSKPIGAVLHAHDSLVAQEQAFVEALRAYNLAIAEYVMAVADLSVPDDRFATMLIGQPRPWRQAPFSAPAFGAGVIPASGTLPAPPFQGAPPLPTGSIPTLGIGPPGSMPTTTFPQAGPPRIGG